MVEKSLKILAIQMSSVIGDKKANFENVQELIETNAFYNPDIVVLPEVWTVGWKPSVFKDSAEDLENSETVDFLSKIAKKYNSNVIGGSFITKKYDKYYNTCPVLNRNGELVATYNKMHLFSYYGCAEGSFVENGQHPVLVNYCLDSGEIASFRHCETLSSGSDNQCPPKQSYTHSMQDANEIASCEELMPSRRPLFRNDLNDFSEGQIIYPSRNEAVVKIGLTICYDIRFPEIYRAYAKAGADVLVNMAAWPLSRAIHWEALTKARAIENQCHMVALTQSGHIEGEDWNLGHSRIIDYKGDVLSEIEEGEGAMFAELKFKEMYEFRNKCTVLLDIHDTYDVQ